MLAVRVYAQTHICINNQKSAIIQRGNRVNLERKVRLHSFHTSGGPGACQHKGRRAFCEFFQIIGCLQRIQRFFCIYIFFINQFLHQGKSRLQILAYVLFPAVELGKDFLLALLLIHRKEPSSDRQCLQGNIIVGDNGHNPFFFKIFAYFFPFFQIPGNFLLMLFQKIQVAV